MNIFLHVFRSKKTSRAFGFAAVFCLAMGLSVVPAWASFSYIDDLWVQSFDGTELSANVYVPDGAGPFPAVIFVNSWALDEYEYIAQARAFAADGYVVLSYSTRGFGKSGGMIDVAGPKDMADLSTMLDVLIAEFPVDPANIGISGISYGGGISLLGLAHEPRIKTAAALSSWSNLADALYRGETPSLVWGGILLASGYFTGEMDPSILENYLELLDHGDVQGVLDWAAQRSAQTFVDAINGRQAPVYIANNFGDNMFPVNTNMELFEQLTGPKKMDLRQGIHTTAELGGLLGLENYTWTQVHRWFDYWLKGIDNGIVDEPQVSMELKFSESREHFETWPSAAVQDERFFLGPRYWFSQGSLGASPVSSWTRNSLTNVLDSGANTGVPVLSALLEGHVDAKVQDWLPGLNRLHSVIWESGPLSQGRSIRGIPTLDLQLTPSRGEAQLMAYLYDVDAWGTGTLITHGTASLHDADPGRRTKVHVEMVGTAYDLPGGHKLAVVVDTMDPLYAVPTLAWYEIEISYDGSRPSVLTVPSL